MPLNTVKFNVKGIVNMAIILVQFIYQSRIKYPLDFLTSVFKFVNIKVFYDKHSILHICESNFYQN